MEEMLNKPKERRLRERGKVPGEAIAFQATQFPVDGGSVSCPAQP
jgi:hypothetical protein